jgi:hypothetical protein
MTNDKCFHTISHEFKKCCRNSNKEEIISDSDDQERTQGKSLMYVSIGDIIFKDEDESGTFS